MAERKKILVTGANGQLGSELRALASAYSDFDFIFTSRQELRVEDSDSVNRFFSTHHPDFCINCAAYTAVDKAETEEDEAYLINAAAVGMLADACTSYHAKLIHLSTDYVFDGSADKPYAEDAPVNPQSAYGRSKLAGEQLAIESRGAIVIRTSWVHSPFGKNFVKTMLRLMQEKPEINVVSDQFGSPTYAADLADAILRIISSGKWIPGIYHYYNDGIITWHQFAEAIRDLSGSKCRVNAIPTSAYPTPAKRPAYSVLNTEKIRKTFDIIVPGWHTSLVRCYDRIASQASA